MGQMMPASQPVNALTGHSAVILLVFNAHNQLWVSGLGTRENPWGPSDTIEAATGDEIGELIRRGWPEAGDPRPAFSLDRGNREVAVWWLRWGHPLHHRPIPGGPGKWFSLAALREQHAASPGDFDPLWAKLLPPILQRAIEIPYLNFNPNEFIYRFRTDKQRNRAIYQSHPVSQDLYQSKLCAAVKAVRRLKENRSGESAVLDFGPVQYVLPSHFGFCLGVQNAIERAYEVISQYPDRRVFMLSELIHNPFVNEDLQRRGLRYLQTDKGVPIIDPVTGAAFWDSLNEEDVVIIPAFGATDEDKVRLLEKGLPLNEFDATCMLVEKVWKAARRFAEDGYTVVIHGKAEHEETKATFSNTARHGPALVIRDQREAGILSEIIGEPDAARQQALLGDHFAGKMTPGFDPARNLRRIAVVNQTTLLRNETIRIIETLEDALRSRFGESAATNLHPQSRGDTLCYATQVNQDALQKALATPLDLALVAGGRNSSNTYQLYRVCQEALGDRAAYIQSEANILGENVIEHYHFAQHLEDPRGGTTEKRPYTIPWDRPMRVLVTGGASCPDGIIQQIIARMNRQFPAASLSSIEDVIEQLENDS